MKFALQYTWLPILLMLCGCATFHKKLNSDSQVHRQIVTNADSIMHQVSETKAYGDTLQGWQAVPQLDLKPFVIHEESSGIDLQATVMPVTDSVSGVPVSYQVHYKIVAKPMKTTNSTTDKQANVRQTLKTDSTARTVIAQSTKAGFALAWWGWLLIAATAGAALYLAVKSWLPNLGFLNIFNKTTQK